MRFDITNSWFRRLPWWGKVFVVAGVLILFSLSAGCSQLAIPTAETASVAASSSVSAAASSPAEAGAAPGSADPPAPAQSPTPESPSGLTPGAMLPATVVRVVDGDTAVFQLASGAREKVRFIGVNTPESTTKKEPYGKEASAYTASKLWVGRSVLLEKDVEPRDRYGRLLAYIWFAKPTAITTAELRVKQLNAKLANDGFAQQMTIPPNVKYADFYRMFVAEARSAGRGLWSGRSPTQNPAAAAAVAAAASASQAGDTAGAAYIGNRNTMRFHRPGCASVNQMNPANKVALASRAQAIGRGYVPCGNCRP